MAKGKKEDATRHTARIKPTPTLGSLSHLTFLVIRHCGGGIWLGAEALIGDRNPLAENRPSLGPE